VKRLKAIHGPILKAFVFHAESRMDQILNGYAPEETATYAKLFAQYALRARIANWELQQILALSLAFNTGTILYIIFYT